MKGESLNEWAARAKARWLNRVMYRSRASSIQKCLAYSICDHLNCVTLDCWPAQATFARLLGNKSTRTIQRAARGLIELGLITVKPNELGNSEYRYAPVLLPEDADNSGGKKRQQCPDASDTNVRESSLAIRSTSSSTEEALQGSAKGRVSRSNFNLKERGAIEVKLAEKLGPDGFDILARLASIDDAIVTRLCRAFVDGVLSERDLEAARLAAQQR
jgi:hypothetical protein